MIRIPKQINGYKVIVDNSMSAYGETDVEKKIIKINRTKSLQDGGREELADTVMHETLHAKNPDLTEQEVRDNMDKVDLSIKGLV